MISDFNPEKGGGIKPRVSPRTRGESKRSITNPRSGWRGWFTTTWFKNQMARISYLRVPVLAIRRHPLTRVQVFAVAVPTGSRTHPWLYAGIPYGIQPQERDVHPSSVARWMKNSARVILASCKDGRGG